VPDLRDEAFDDVADLGAVETPFWIFIHSREKREVEVDLRGFRLESRSLSSSRSSVQDESVGLLCQVSSSSSMRRQPQTYSHASTLDMWILKVLSRRWAAEAQSKHLCCLHVCMGARDEGSRIVRIRRQFKQS
jgi:hypothetical protein